MTAWQATGLAVNGSQLYSKTRDEFLRLAHGDRLG